VASSFIRKLDATRDDGRWNAFQLYDDGWLRIICWNECHATAIVALTLSIVMIESSSILILENKNDIIKTN
jgi:hypothetical protein